MKVLKSMKLSEVGECIRGVSYKKDQLYESENSDSVTLFRANNIYNHKILFNNVQYVSKKAVSERQYLREGDIIICMSSGSKHLLGKAALFEMKNKEFTVGAFCSIFRPNNKVNMKYLKFIFQSNLYKEQIKRFSTATNINNLKKTDIENIEIPILEKFYGKILINIMHRAEKLKDQRQKSNVETNKIIRNIFYQIFGNYLINNKNFQKVSFIDVFNITTGKLNSNAAAKHGKYPFFTCSKETFSIDDYSFDCEALLLAGNNAAGEYSVKYYNGKFDAYQRTYVLTLKNKDWSYKFFQILLELKLNELKRISIGTNTKYLTLGIMRLIELIVPPLELQKRFEKFVKKIELIKSKQKKSTEEINTLFDALMQKAFKGELAV